MFMKIIIIIVVLVTKIMIIFTGIIISPIPS